MCRSCMELLPGVPLSVMFDPHMPWLSALRVESSRMLSINADLTLRLSACTAVMTHASLCRCRLPSSAIPHGEKRCARDEICHDPAPSCVVSIDRVVSGLVATCTRSPCLEHHMQVMSVNVRSIWGSHHLHSMQIVVGARYGAATCVEILVCGH